MKKIEPNVKKLNESCPKTFIVAHFICSYANEGFCCHDCLLTPARLFFAHHLLVRDKFLVRPGA